MSDQSSWERIAAFVFGLVFVIALLVLAVAFPNPAPFQYIVFRIVLALAGAGVAAVIPGFLSVRTDALRVAIRAGGALAVFAVVYLINPAQLVTQPNPVQSVIQQSAGPNSPNISGVQGTVTIIQPPSAESPSQSKAP